MPTRMTHSATNRPTRNHLLALALCLAAAGAPAQITVFDAGSNVVSIPSVSVGPATYTDVRLLHLGNYTFTLQSATEQAFSSPGVGTYNAANGILTLPAVRLGSETYIDVTLKDIGNYTFTLQNATLLPATTEAAVRALFASSDAIYATAVPTTGAARYALSDLCQRSNGRTRAWLIADWDANRTAYAARDAFIIGRVSTNIQVLAVRNSTNPDGSARQEIETQSDEVFADGTTAIGVKNRLISGSSAGTPGCTTPQSAAALRFLGNQQVVATAVRARATREERYAAATGAALSPSVFYRRAVQFNVTDPMGNASYVVVSGPGPVATVNGVENKFSLKLLSTRLLRSAPELVGKSGNFLNWLDEDSFRICNAPNGTSGAALADCVGLGTGGFDWGFGFTSTPNAAADNSFAQQGWVKGGVYRFDVYADDGWKTVNGQAGKTPVATYYETLDTLPYPFVELAGSGTSADRFPRLGFGGLTPALLWANAVSATPSPVSLSWNPPGTFAAGRKLGVVQAWEFHQGGKIGNPGNALNPGYRTINYSYPSSTALALPGLAVSPRLADQASKTFFEFSLLYGDRNDIQLLTIVNFR